MKKFKKKYLDLRLIMIVCIIFALRTVGLFMVPPILSMYGIFIQNSNKLLIGACIGIYSFSQVIFQIPFSYLSDKFSREKVIIFGLILFFIGSIIAASTMSIWGIFIGRMLQGSGAISSALITLLLETVKKDNRLAAIVCVGITFSCTFVISIILAPIIVNFVGLNNLFWIMAILTIISIAIVIKFIKPMYVKDVTNNTSISIINLFRLLKNVFLLELLLNTFSISYLLTSNFFIYPEYLILMKITKENYWMFYSTIIFIACITGVPIIYHIRNYSNIRKFYLLCISFLLLSCIGLLVINNPKIFLINIQIFIFIYVVMSALLPTAINEKSPKCYKGSFMSIYNTSQFLGTFVSSLINGWLLNKYSLDSTIYMNIIIIIFCIIFNIITNFRHKIINK
ncbi:transporter, major facilitator family protein [Buchnera aphidicola (Nipponaphis monzeni)]|uniref:Transporter, major facilitator family protein n=1 Tax=Buchnera aphidicola (Nipponaphis monzeni) TaxID=2495405 RepID=A0A455TAJ4_9GAMM|nr:MFS transporter [Buchnera aphidicola]BBI01354.1 transporter, major facilitator family protein [Buchnera aphidicola (Nipponaphis monzeni)]